MTTQRYLHPDTRAITDAGNALSAHLAGRWSPSGPQLRVVHAAGEVGARSTNGPSPAVLSR
jgi:hypothetical protein